MEKCRWTVSLLFVVLNIIVVCAENGRNVNDTCQFPDGVVGVCQAFADCPAAVQALREKVKPTTCSYDGVAIVCCPPPTRVSELMCKHYSKEVYRTVRIPTLLLDFDYENATLCGMAVQELIVGGETAAPKEFPHMVNLGYGDESDISWKCGGTLISEEFVLTAAHCVSNKGENVTWARTGDLVMGTDEDVARPETYRIIASHKHPDYKLPAKYNDIALLKLDRKVNFSEYARPACLDRGHPTSDGTLATATGWGVLQHNHKDTSNSLMKVHFPFRNSAVCVEGYSSMSKTGAKLKRGFTDDTMICAGSYIPGQDTCQGDSGGPLQTKMKNLHCMYNIVGVTSFGHLACGITAVPGVYTRVSHYLDWIEAIVWPNGVTAA